MSTGFLEGFVWCVGTMLEEKTARSDNALRRTMIDTNFTGAISVLIAGLYWKRASSTGAACALIAGFSALLGLGTVQEWFGLSGWKSWNIGLITLVVAAVAMVVGSLAFPDRLDPKAPPPEEVA